MRDAGHPQALRGLGSLDGTTGPRAGASHATGRPYNMPLMSHVEMCRHLQTLADTLKRAFLQFFCLFGASVWGKGVMTWVPRGGGSKEGTTGDLLSHQPEFLGTPLNYYKLLLFPQVSPGVYGAGHLKS